MVNDAMETIRNKNNLESVESSKKIRTRKKSHSLN